MFASAHAKSEEWEILAGQSCQVCTDVALLKKSFTVCVLFIAELSVCATLLPFSFFCALCRLCTCATVRWLPGVLGQERSGLNYADALIRALGKVAFCTCGCVKCLWICTVTMLNSPESGGGSQGLCVCLRLCVRPLFNMKAGETEG